MHFIDDINFVAALRGREFIFSRRSRMSSTLVLEAASISIKSRKRPSLTATQLGHWLHGRSAGFGAKQLTALANSELWLFYGSARPAKDKRDRSVHCG